MELGQKEIQMELDLRGSGSAGAGTPEAWRNGILHGVEGGKGAIMIGTEEKSVTRGLIIDPGGGASTYMYAGEGKLFYPEITGKRKRTNHEEGRGEITDPGGGGDLDRGGGEEGTNSLDSDFFPLY